jgi:hypothetical protein
MSALTAGAMIAGPLKKVPEPVLLCTVADVQRDNGSRRPVLTVGLALSGARIDSGRW